MMPDDLMRTEARLDALTAPDPHEYLSMSRVQALSALPRALVLRCSSDELVELLDAVRGVHHDGVVDGHARYARRWREAQERLAAKCRKNPRDLI